MSFILNNNSIESIMNTALNQRECLVLKELQKLIDSGVLTIEFGDRHLIKNHMNNNIELVQSININIKEKERIEQLEKENSELKISLQAIRNALEAINKP